MTEHEELLNSILEPLERAEFANRDLLVRSLRKILAPFSVEDLKELKEKADVIIDQFGGNLETGSLENPTCDFDCRYPATDDGCSECPKGGAN
jgi:hypothetical protein